MKGSYGMGARLRRRAQQNPHLEVTRRDANELLDIAWNNFVNDWELYGLWKELEELYGLRWHNRESGSSLRFYYLDEVKKALERRERGEVHMRARPDCDTASDDEEDERSFDFGDNELVTVDQVYDTFALKPVADRYAVLRRLGIQRAGETPAHKPLYRFGDVRQALEEREREWE